MLQAQLSSLDIDYIERWAPELGVLEEWWRHVSTVEAPSDAGEAERTGSSGRARRGGRVRAR